MSRWMFLSIFASIAACNGEKDDGGGGGRESDILALEGDEVAGQAVYDGNCASCHSPDGSGGIGPAIAGSDEEPEEVISIILNGEGDMTGFGTVLDDQEIADCYAYVLSL